LVQAAPAPWLPRVVDLLTILLIVANSIGGELLLPFIPHSLPSPFSPLRWSFECSSLCCSRGWFG